MDRIIGLDIGDKRIGVAVSDGLYITAQSVEVYHRINRAKDLDKIKSIVLEYEAGKIVVGIPKNLDGTLGPQSEKILKFKSFLESSLKVPIVTWDERFTSKIARNVLISGNVKRKKRRLVIDKMAAQLILQGYMDCNPTLLKK